MKTSSHSICASVLCVYLTTKQLNKGEREKFPNEFDTLNTLKRKWTKRKNSPQRRERRIGLLHLLLLSSHMTATMDVDSDDDDEIIAERGTIAHILIFSRRARVYTSFSLITSDDERKGGDL